MGSPRADPPDTAGVGGVFRAMDSLHLSPLTASFGILIFPQGRFAS